MFTRTESCGPCLSSPESMLRIIILDCHPWEQLHSILFFQNNSYFKKHFGLGIIRFTKKDQMKPEGFCFDKLPLGMENSYSLSSIKKKNTYKRPTGVEDAGKRAYKKPEPLFIHLINYL